MLSDRAKDPTRLDVVIEKTEFRQRVHQVQCQDRWVNGCQAGKCSVFQVTGGNYYCTQKRLG